MTTDPTNIPTTEPTPAPVPVEQPAAPAPAAAPTPPEAPPTEREVKLAEQHRKSRERRVRDEASFRGENPDEAVEKDRAARETDAAADQRQRDAQGRFAPKAGETAPAAPVADEPKFKAKIDGREVEVPLSELVKNYQLEQAARRKLTEADRYLAEAKARAGQGSPAPMPSGAVTAAATGTADQAGALMVRVKGSDGVEREVTFGHATVYGTEDEANQAAAQLLERARQGRTEGVTIDQVAGFIYENQQRAAEGERVTKIVGDYPAVFKDEDVASLAYGHSMRLMRDDLLANWPEYGDAIRALPLHLVAERHRMARRAGAPVRAPEALLKEGAETVARKFGIATIPAAQAQADRLDRKRQAHQPPASTSARQPPTTEAPARKTAAQITADMKRMRGQVGGLA